MIVLEHGWNAWDIWWVGLGVPVGLSKLDCHFEYISREFGFVDKVDPFSAVVVFIIGCTT